MLPLLPASAAVTTVTVTIDLIAGTRGLGCQCVCVHTRHIRARGERAAVGDSVGSVHVPPASGLPPSCANRPVATPLLHKVIAPSVPASAAVVSVTVTVAVAFAQGAVPVIV